MKTLQLAWITVSTWFTERLSRDERGATAVEYGIMVALIAAVIVLVVQALGLRLQDRFCFVLTQIGGTCP